jgi:hypothetical protein
MKLETFYHTFEKYFNLAPLALIQSFIALSMMLVQSPHPHQATTTTGCIGPQNPRKCYPRKI